jgi:hypothetical protein
LECGWTIRHSESHYSGFNFHPISDDGCFPFIT